MSEIIVHKSGLYTSIQDSGRFGFRSFGVPQSGFMDQQSAHFANLLVNNPPGTALLEITLSGPTLEFKNETRIAITGANLSPTLNDNPIQMSCPIDVRKGDIIAFGRLVYGVRSYLSIQNGLESMSILGSCSQYSTLTAKGVIEKNDVIRFKSIHHPFKTYSKIKVDTDHFSQQLLEVTIGPEYDLLSGDQKESLSNIDFTIGENSRMGYQFQQEKSLENSLEILTSPVIPGTVQLTPSGSCIVLMRDGQVTGGYPRVLQLRPESINRLAQKKAGDQIEFHL